MSRAGTAVAGAAPATPDAASPPHAASTPDALPEDAHRPGPAAGRWRGAVASYLVYQALALVPWWHLLGHLGSALPAGSADPGQEVWFLAQLPHALGSGTDPFFSRAIFAPHGVNLLSNTSMPLIGLLLAPVTVTAGPVAALGVAVLLAPALSALGAFALCRRHVSWQPAAFVGGLCYGFGPFLVGDLRYAHLDLTWLVLPPLVLLCLDALLVTRTDRPLLTGGLLGALVVAQFFVSTEILAITAVLAVAGAILFALAHPRAAGAALRASGRGLALAAGIAVTVLAYPTFLVVAGPRHVSGPVWPHIGQIATSLASTVVPHGELAGVAFVSGANGSYLGAGMLAVLAVGAVVLWRSSVLRASLVLAAVAYVASLGYDMHVGHSSTGVAMPASLLGHVPLLDSIVPERFSVMVDLFTGVALAVIVDHVHSWTRPARAAGGTGTRGEPAALHALHALAAPRAAYGVLAAAVAAFALVPIAAQARWPYPAARVARPAVLTTPRAWSQPGSGPSTAPPVAVVYPDSSAAVSDQMVWQAQDGFGFTLPDGYAIVPGKAGRAVEAPRTDALWLVLAAASLGRLHAPPGATTRAAVRADLRALHARVLIVLPHARGSAAVVRAARSMLGPPSAVVGGAALWRFR